MTLILNHDSWRDIWYPNSEKRWLFTHSSAKSPWPQTAFLCDACRAYSHSPVCVICVHNFVPNQVDCVRDVHTVIRDKNHDRHLSLPPTPVLFFRFFSLSKTQMGNDVRYATRFYTVFEMVNRSTNMQANIGQTTRANYHAVPAQSFASK